MQADAHPDGGDSNDFAAQMRAERARRRLTQGEVAAELGVLSQTISQWELGKKIPQVRHTDRLAAFLRMRDGNELLALLGRRVEAELPVADVAHGDAADPHVPVPDARPQRFWIPYGRSASRTRPGWLADPVSGRFVTVNPDIVPTRALASYRCLVLLGEPGMGKSTEIRRVDPMIDSTVSARNLRFDLGEFSSEDRLARRVFEHPEIEQWRADDSIMCLTLDSFDEARTRIETLPRMLSEYLREWDCARLFLRLVCRTADWPTSLRPTLDEAFKGLGNAVMFELLPLRRRDALSILSADETHAHTKLSPEQILTAVENAHLVPLAARPLTLDLISGAIRKEPDKSLPSSAAELYDKGLLALADETSAVRRDAWANRIGPATRLKAAKRLAALSIFGGHPTIWMGSAGGGDTNSNAPARTNDLMLADLTTPPPSWDDSVPWPHTEETLQQTVRSGFFTGAGDHRVSWAHATFADYLTARWIIESNLADQQVRSLVLTTDGRIHRRFRQLAAWLVRVAPARFDDLITSDPEAFLANVDLPGDDLRRQLVEAVIESANSGDLFHDYDWSLKGLSHPSIGAQLSSALDAPRHDTVRIAVSIARQCQVTEIVPRLTTLALDPSLDPHLRVTAALGVYDLATSNPTSDLATLIPTAGELGPSSEKNALAELTGAALLASWPHALSTSEVFDRLRPQHARNFTGIYAIFIHNFADGLARNDLPQACAWLTHDPARLDDTRLEPLVSAILRLCVHSLDDDTAQTTLRHVAARRAQTNEPLFPEQPFPDKPELTETERRTVALVLLDDVGDDDILNLIDTWSSHGQALIRASDFGWLIDQYDQADTSLREGIATALRHMYNPGDVSHSDIVLGIGDTHPAAELFTYWRSVIYLDSQQAADARESWRDIYRYRDERRRRDASAPDKWVNPRIVELAREAAGGNIEAFWTGVHLVTVRPNTEVHRDEHQPDLSAHPRWDALPPHTRQQIVDAAPVFLANALCEPEKWFAQDKISFVAAAAYRALILLLREAPSRLQTLDGRVWREWAPILIDWTATVNGASVDDKKVLFDLAIPHARDELQVCLLELVDEAIASERHTFLRAEMEWLMDEDLAVELLNRLNEPMAATTRGDLLDTLSSTQSQRLTALMIGWLDDTARATDRERAQEAVIRLLQGRAADAWPQLRALMSRDPDFMMDALNQNRFYYDDQPPELPEADLADLYIWVCRHFPGDEDPQHEDAHIVGPREALATWRDGLLSALRDAGTDESVAQVKRVAAEFPERTWLAHTVALARRALREHGWSPMTVTQLDELAIHPARRIVRTDNDLLAASVEALTEIQTALQSDSPTAPLLWDTAVRQPKTEEQISDYLQHELSRRLNDRNVIVNREVQVRRSNPSAGIPERTDLRIEAIDTTSGKPSVHLVIAGEVKGSWNKKLIPSIQSQLTDRYMKDLHTNSGLYVVAWFDHESWTSESDESRKSAARKWGTIQHLRDELDDERIRQAERGLTISTIVLDFSLRRPEVASTG